VAAHATDWLGDAFALGSYSYIPIEGSADDMLAIAGRWSPRLVFAGEHTVPEYFGTVHGAHLSGLRAAAAFG
jgi:monoamine oxidase